MPNANIKALLTIEQLQGFLHRSKASVYRYTNVKRADGGEFNEKKLNPEPRTDPQRDPLMFDIEEVKRFAKEVLRMPIDVSINVVETPVDAISRQVVVVNRPGNLVLVDPATMAVVGRL